MAKIWVIAPYDSGEVETFDAVWNFDLKNNTIALGWVELGDVSKISRNELEILYEKTYKDENKAKAVKTKDINALWTFYHEIQEGDVIIARRGRKRILSIGTVIGKAYYDLVKGELRIGGKKGHVYPNFISVAWNGKEISYEDQIFSFYTIYEIPKERYDYLINYPLEKTEQNDKKEENDEPVDEEITIAETEFALEKYLEEFIVSNFNTIFNNQYILYIDPDGNPGQQYPLLSEDGKIFGRIDILAIEKHTKDFIVIELKKGKESDPVIGQTLRYIGWVKENLCEEKQSVKGIVICREVDKKMLYAVQPLKDLIKVKKYKVDFKLFDEKIEKA